MRLNLITSNYPQSPGFVVYVDASGSTQTGNLNGKSESERVILASSNQHFVPETLIYWIEVGKSSSIN